MSLRTIILAVCLASGTPALAQVTPTTPIERANADAVSRLYARIASEEIANVPVSQIVERVNGYSIVMGGLGRAEQVGGPRQLTDNLVQVRLQISGTRASQLIVQAVAAKPDQSPVPLERLTFLLRSWGDRTFTSTGDNVATDGLQAVATEPSTAMTAMTTTRPIEAMQLPATRIETPEPPMAWRPAPAWVADPLVASGTATSVGSPLRTARAAELAARGTLRAQIAALSTGEKTKVGDDLDHHPDVAAAIDDAIAAARVSSVDYRADGSVEVHVSVGGQRLWQRIATAR